MPQDHLVFGVVQRPWYGFLINGVHGYDILHYKQLINHDHHSHELFVHDFSMEQLKNGRYSILLTLVFHFFNKARWLSKKPSPLIYSLALCVFPRQCLGIEVNLMLMLSIDFRNCQENHPERPTCPIG